MSFKVAAELLSTKIDVDCFRIDLAGRATVQVDTAGQTNTRGELLDGNGALIASDPMPKRAFAFGLRIACAFGLALAGLGISAQGTNAPHICSHSAKAATGRGSWPLGQHSAMSVRDAAGMISITAGNQILIELSPEDTTPPNLFDLNGRTLVFRPDGRGGYSRAIRSLEWEENLGTDVTIEGKFRDGVEIEFDAFEFDYAGRRWNSVFVSKHGLLTFGSPLEYSKHFAAWFSPMSESAARLANTPTISALYKPAFGGLYGRDPLAAQFVARLPDRVVVTWYASEYDAYRLDVPDHAERFQAILHADGVIQLNYGHITVGDGVVGLFSDAVERTTQLARITNPEDAEIPGHLDLLDVTLYESNTDALIVEWTMRDAIPTPPSGTKYSYRVYFDTDEPYFDGDGDDDFWWSVDVEPDGGRTRGGTRLPTNAANRIALLVEDRAVRGVTAGIRPSAAQFDDGNFVRGNWNSPFTPIQITLPSAPPPTDLSRADGGSSSRQSEVFHHRGVPGMATIACRIIESLGDRFDLFVFHNEFRVDAQMNDSDWRNYYNGVRGIGREDTWRGPRCGDGRLLGHYAKVVRVGQEGGRIHDWRNGDFESDLTLLAHELTHSWTAYLSYVDSNGSHGHLFADSFADACQCHWRGALHAPAAFPWGGERADSLMTGGEGGGFWHDNGDGTFTAITDFGGASGLSWLDLYAMGLAGASEVQGLYVLHNLEPVPGNDRAGRNGRHYGTYRADKESIPIDRIVAAMGRREPSAARSRKELNAGFVYLLEPGRTPTPEMLRLHKDYIDTVVEYWSHITGGRSQITTTLFEGTLPPGVKRYRTYAVVPSAESLPTVEARAGGESTQVDLDALFVAEDDGRLTFTAESSDDDVVAARTDGATLQVNPRRPGTANIKITATAPNGDEAERVLVITVLFDHGDSAESATLLSIGPPRPGTIGDASDVDVFRIDLLGSATLEVRTSGPTDTRGELRDGSGTRLATDDDSGPGRRNFLVRRALDAGTYYVTVTGELGEYAVMAQLADAQDHGETAAMSTLLTLHPEEELQRVSPNALLATPGRIAPTNADVDVFRLDVPQDDTDVVIRSSGTTDVHARLLDASLTELAADASEGNFRIEARVDAGVHYVVVQGTERGAYRVLAYGASASCPCAVASVTRDHGQDAEGSTIMPIGRPLVGAIADSTDTDVFRIDLQGRATLEVRTSGPTNTRGELLDGTGARLLSDDDSGPGGHNFLLRTALEAGIYYVPVTGKPGDYAVMASLGDARDHGGTGATATLLPLYAPDDLRRVSPNALLATPGRIAPDDIDAFRLDVPDNDTDIAIRTAGGTDVFLRLVDASLNEVASDASAGNSRIEARLDAGIYYAFVIGRETGTYRVLAWRNSAKACACETPPTAR